MTGWCLVREEPYSFSCLFFWAWVGNNLHKIRKIMILIMFVKQSTWSWLSMEVTPPNSKNTTLAGWHCYSFQWSFFVPPFYQYIEQISFMFFHFFMESIPTWSIQISKRPLWDPGRLGWCCCRIQDWRSTKSALWRISETRFEISGPPHFCALQIEKWPK